MEGSALRVLAILLLATGPRAALGQDTPPCRADPTHPRCGARWVMVVPSVTMPPLASPVVASPAHPPVNMVVAPLPALRAFPAAAYPAYAVPAPSPSDALAGAMMFLGASLMLHDLRYPAPGPRFRPRR